MSVEVGDRVKLLHDEGVKITSPDVRTVPNSKLGLPFDTAILVTEVQVWMETLILIKVEGCNDLLRMKRFTAFDPSEENDLILRRFFLY